MTSQARRIAELEALVADLPTRLGVNSSNSSKPPSSDGPHVKPAPPKTPSGKRRGGQPGHRRHERTRREPTRVIEVKPRAGGRCGSGLSGDDPDSSWRQVVELLPVRPGVTEYRTHALTCPGCGAATAAEAPPESASEYGSSLQASLSMLSVNYRLGKRSVRALAGDLLGLDISSPHDPEARYARKDTTTWVGYKVHLTETCDDDSPHLITHVETTLGPVADGDVTPVIHTGLQAKDLLPAEHLADTGYVDAELLVNSRQEYGVDLVGPTRADYHWQARAGDGFAAGDFRVDWEQQRMTCPEGRQSSGWTPAVDRGHNQVIKVKFSAKDCGACPSKGKCTRGTRRSVTIRPREQYEALELARRREGTSEYKEGYGKRAGVEGTITQGVRACGMRRSRYAGEAKTHLQHLATAAALNVLRIGDWLAEKPREQTRASAFARLMTPLAAAA